MATNYLSGGGQIFRSSSGPAMTAPGMQGMSQYPADYVGLPTTNQQVLQLQQQNAQMYQQLQPQLQKLTQGMGGGSTGLSFEKYHAPPTKMKGEKEKKDVEPKLRHEKMVIYPASSPFADTKRYKKTTMDKLQKQYGTHDKNQRNPHYHPTANPWSLTPKEQLLWRSNGYKVGQTDPLGNVNPTGGVQDNGNMNITSETEVIQIPTQEESTWSIARETTEIANNLITPDRGGFIYLQSIDEVPNSEGKLFDMVVGYSTDSTTTVQPVDLENRDKSRTSDLYAGISGNLTSGFVYGSEGADRSRYTDSQRDTAYAFNQTGGITGGGTQPDTSYQFKDFEGKTHTLTGHGVDRLKQWTNSAGRVHPVHAWNACVHPELVRIINPDPGYSAMLQQAKTGGHIIVMPHLKRTDPLFHGKMVSNILKYGSPSHVQHWTNRLTKMGVINGTRTAQMMANDPHTLQQGLFAGLGGAIGGLFGPITGTIGTLGGGLVDSIVGSLLPS